MGGWTDVFPCLPETQKEIHIRRPRDMDDVNKAESTPCPMIACMKCKHDFYDKSAP
jgi:hypothetical protein